MAHSIEITEELLARVIQRYGPTRLGESIEWIIERDLRDPTVDPLTSTRSKSSLNWDVYCAVDEAARSGKNYVESFLCCDVDNFSHFVNCHGHGFSDQSLVKLADRLKTLNKPVYRHGGDEFVVVGQAETLGTLRDLDISVRQCVVHVNLEIDFARRCRAGSWIMYHIHRGCVQCKTEGDRILCCNNPAWSSR